MSFNPNIPNSLGLEWLQGLSGATALSSPSASVAIKIHSTVTETISKLIVPYTWAASPTYGYGAMLFEIYDLSNMPTGLVTENTYYPNADLSPTLMYSSAYAALTAGNIFGKIDETAGDDDTDYVIMKSDSRTLLNFNTAAVTGQIAYIKFIVRVFGQACTSPRLDLNLGYSGSYTFGGTLGVISPSADSIPGQLIWRDYIVGPLYINPLTGLPWTAADVVSFSSATGKFLWLQSRPELGVSRVRMLVGSAVEKRVAIGSTTVQGTPDLGIDTNDFALLTTPAGVANWAKLTGKDYLVLVRRREQIGQPTLVPSIVWTGDQPTPHGTGTQYSTVIDNAGIITDVGSVMTRTTAVIMGTSGGAISADSNPYHSLTAQSVVTGVTMRQRLSGASAQVYQSVNFVVGVTEASLPTGDLLIKIKRVSDNVQLGGTITITATTLTTATVIGTVDGIKWYRVSVMASVATLAAVQYYLEFTSTTAVASPWSLQMANFTQTHALTGNVSYGGATDYADLNGTSAATYGDFVAVLSSAVAAPPTPVVVPVPIVDPSVGAATGAGGSLPIPEPGHICGDPGELTYARITWGAPSPAMGAVFLRYEVERSEDGGTTYKRIATIALEATHVFADYEALRNTDLKYRVRAVRTDGAMSPWSTTGTIQCTMTGQAVLFTSNAQPALSTGYIWMGAEHQYGFPKAGQTSFVDLHGRDLPVAFKPTEAAGVVWPFRVLVYSDGMTGDWDLTAPPDGPGWRAFDTLRAIAEADIPYVTVLTPDGERMYAALQVSTGDRIEPAMHYEAAVTATQIASSAAVTVA